MMTLQLKTGCFEKILSYFTILATGLILFSAVAFSQATTGDIAGTVTDNTNSAIGNARVVATRVDTNQSFTVTTNSSGEFRFANLPVGNYTLRAIAKGFKETVLKDFLVELNKTASVRLGLEVGTVDVTVEVTSSAPTIDTTSSQLGTTFDTKLED